MAPPPFDSMHALRFDLNRGTVCAVGRDERLLLVPADALAVFARSAPAHVGEAFAGALGRTIGERAAQRLADRDAASVDEFVAQLAGEAALTGIGVLSVERWGRALVVVIEQCPLDGSWLVPLIVGALGSSSGRQIWGMLLAHDRNVARILVASEGGVARAKELLAAGTTWAEALQRIHGEHS